MKSSLALNLRPRDYELKILKSILKSRNLVWNLEILSEISKSLMKSWEIQKSLEKSEEIQRFRNLVRYFGECWTPRPHPPPPYTHIHTLEHEQLKLHSYITYKTAYTHSLCQVSFASYKHWTKPFFFMIEKMWLAGSKKHKLNRYGLMSNQHTRWVQRLYLIPSDRLPQATE